MSRLADQIMCPPLVRTARTLHLPGCPGIRGAKTYPCPWAVGQTLGQVYDSLQGPGRVKPCRGCDPLFLPTDSGAEHAPKEHP